MITILRASVSYDGKSLLDQLFRALSRAQVSRKLQGGNGRWGVISAES